MKYFYWAILFFSIGLNAQEEEKTDWGRVFGGIESNMQYYQGFK